MGETAADNSSGSFFVFFFKRGQKEWPSPPTGTQTESGGGGRWAQAR